MRIGIDIGSTTVKVVLLDDQDNTVFHTYERHMSKVREKTAEMLRLLSPRLSGQAVQVAVTGSAGLGVAKAADLEFVQEVFATAGAVEKFLPDTDAVVELGGEDAKIIFLTGGLEERMNGSCAGGTGAFIDQMATLLGITADELDRLSLGYEKLYAIASRCGVFAKSDIQPLLNQGARKEDIAASIFQAVVNQTITGLAQGRQIGVRSCFWAVRCFFLEGLRRRFVETLKLSPENAVFPETADVFVAVGAACYAANSAPMDFDDLLERLSNTPPRRKTQPIPWSPSSLTRTTTMRSWPATTPTARRLWTRTAIRGRLSGHRCRFHHHQAGADLPGRRAAFTATMLPTRATRSPSCSDSFARFTADSATESSSGQRLHRLWGGSG